ncbi:MAG: hypothetical protein NZN45_11560 [Rhodovarius sp.]|nr:hypothetical protein [Rhodovarius sp.]
MAEAPAALLVHRLPGRLRLRLPALRGDAAGMAALSARIAALPGVSRAEASALTGSLVLFHDGPTESLLAQAEAAGLFALRRGDAPSAAPQPGPAPAPAALLPALGAAAAGLLALVQILRQQLLPPALVLATQAWQLARQAMAAAQAAAATTEAGEGAEAGPPAAED